MAEHLIFNINFLDENGEDVLPSETKYRRFAFEKEDSISPFKSIADTYNIDPTIAGYDLVEVIGEQSGDFTFSNKHLTFVYKKVDSINPTDPVDLNNLTDDNETDRSISPKEEDLEVPIKPNENINKKNHLNKPKAKLDEKSNQTLPSTGIGVSYKSTLFFF